MPSALLRARLPTVALLLASPLGALLGCELFVEDMPPPADEQGAAGRPAGHSGGAGNQGTSGGAPSNGGAAGGAVGTGGTSGGCVRPCDCDGDGATAKSCGGPDCDDGDRNVRPNEPNYFDTPSKAAGFDYDCNNRLDRDPLQPGPVVCNALTLTNCNTSQGFLRALPECGQAGVWGTCVKTTLSCIEDTRSSQVVMRCK